LQELHAMRGLPPPEREAQNSKHELLMVVLERFYPRWHYRGFRVMSWGYVTTKLKNLTNQNASKPEAGEIAGEKIYTMYSRLRPKKGGTAGKCILR